MGLSAASPSGPTVGLFVTCLADLFRPSIGFAALELLQRAGCRVRVPETQTCCGQPAYNGGDKRCAEDLAGRVIDAFAGFDYLVAPSGSCAAMIARHYPALFAEQTERGRQARVLAGKTFELTGFLVDELGAETVPARLDGIAVYHDSCSGLREMGIADQPRKLLASVQGLVLRDAGPTGGCCGFGGTFSVSFGEISTRMADDCLAGVGASGAGLLLGGDLGCLMQLAGRLKRLGSGIQVRHVAEVLAGRTEVPAIGEPRAG
jgi:L-lactate dehydrogenase complex protein LldE